MSPRSVEKKVITADESSATRERMPGIDALRAFAVTLTFVMHFAWLYAATFFNTDLESRHVELSDTVERAIVTGQYYSLYGVYLFFMISGLLIGRRWVTPNQPRVIDYLADRARRIFPAFWFSLAAAYALAVFRGITLPHSLVDVAANASLVNWFAPTLSTPWLIVSWSLQTEWIFYLCMPPIALGLTLLSPKNRSSALICITVIAMACLKALGDRHFAYPLFFVIGISVAINPSNFRTIAQRLNMGFLAALLLILHATYACYAPIGAAKPAWQFGHYDLFVLAFAVVGGAIFIKMTFVPPTWLLARPILALGRISYSFYLWHITILIALFEIVAKAPLAYQLQGWSWGLRWLLLFIICGGTSIVVSWLAFRLIEAPYFASRLSKRRTLAHEKSL